jgi:4-alpha-glucanotransferase
VSERLALRALAKHAGIEDGYYSALDHGWVPTGDATREALLSAMGLDASTEAAAARTLVESTERAGATPLEPVAVVVAGRPEARWLGVRGGALDARSVSIVGDEGFSFEGAADVAGDGGVALPELAPGRYRISLEPGGARQLRYVVPIRCASATERLGGRGGFGICVNLYSVRTATNWGFGNLGDLAALTDHADREGAAFVGLNPLHSLAPGGVCPYLPLSRLFRYPLYLDPTRIPELARCPAAQRMLESAGFRAELARLRAGDRLEAGAVGALLDGVLPTLHRAFAAGAWDPERARAFEQYRAVQGSALGDFATFSALADQMAAQGAGRDWRGWPEGFRSPANAPVRRFRAEHPEAVERHEWIQFELDRQLGAVVATAELPLGLYTDLALGSDPAGSDAWAFPELFARGARVGAPPDGFSRDGQEWGFPPLDPAALRQGGHEFWVTLLRAGFRHAGALRIDHAMGMARLFWIPEGRPPSEGAYVRYPADELLGILALESRRHGAAVIAEDLGTVPDGFAEQLAERGILSSRVMLFERDGDAFRPAARYPKRCLVTANTHDLPPLAALAGDADLELRRRAGHLADDTALSEARAERATCRSALQARLREDGWLETDAPDFAQLAGAVTAFLTSTPASLVGLSLDDLAGEHEPVNLPGVPPERHASWTRRLRSRLDEVWQGAPARACLAAVPPARRSGGRDQSAC